MSIWATGNTAPKYFCKPFNVMSKNFIRKVEHSCELIMSFLKVSVWSEEAFPPKISFVIWKAVNCFLSGWSYEVLLSTAHPYSCWTLSTIFQGSTCFSINSSSNHSPFPWADYSPGWEIQQIWKLHSKPIAQDWPSSIIRFPGSG